MQYCQRQQRQLYLCGFRSHASAGGCGNQREKAEAGLNSLGLTGRDLDGILVTHEHMDHVAGLGVMARKYDVPIYATPGTLEEIQKMENLGKIDPELFREVKEDVKLTIKDLTVNPMKISHDAAQPVGYRIAYGNKKSESVRIWACITITPWSA